VQTDLTCAIPALICQQKTVDVEHASGWRCGSCLRDKKFETSASSKMRNIQWVK